MLLEYTGHLDQTSVGPFVFTKGEATKVTNPAIAAKLAKNPKFKAVEPKKKKAKRNDA